MNGGVLPEEWEILRVWLPEDLNERARKTGFMQRARGLQDAERWLRLILMHVAGRLSLQQTAVRARELGLAEITSVALFKRLRKAERWLADLTQHMLAEHLALRSVTGRVQHVSPTNAQDTADDSSFFPRGVSSPILSRSIL